LQFIDAAGAKTFLKRARKVVFIGNLDASRFFLCEGYATAATETLGERFFKERNARRMEE
jgi:phage/plasmid primase-like uncharacterized protein